MAEKRCVYKCGAWNCGSYQFNLYKDDIDQSELCDVHYWQTKAQRPWQGLTDEEFLEACQLAERGNYLVAFQRIQIKLKAKNT